MADTTTSHLRAEMKGLLSSSVSQTLALSDLSSLLLHDAPDADKLEKAANRLARAANNTRAMAENLFRAAQTLRG